MKIVWFIASLEQKGGGERFTLEGAKALQNLGHKVIIICDRLSPEASFYNHYDLSKIICLENKIITSNETYLRKIARKALGTFSLYKSIRKISPDLVICQSEFDCIKLYLISKVFPIRYRTFVFGQMYQFKEDLSKYSSTFKKHLIAITKSCPDYKERVILPPPKLSTPTWIANEAISKLKLKSLQASEKVFTLSAQIKWEVSLLYNKDASVCRAAFDENFIDCSAIEKPRKCPNAPRFISVCRLVEKKRVDLIIRAFDTAVKPATLVIIGTGQEEQALRKLVENCKRRQSIVFLGQVSDERLQNELVKSNCFISMDVSDFEISVLEAIAKGLRAIVSDNFDTSTFHPPLTGVQKVKAEISVIAECMDSIQSSEEPSITNISTLKCLTWQNLASQCTS